MRGAVAEGAAVGGLTPGGYVCVRVGVACGAEVGSGADVGSRVGGVTPGG